MRALCVALSASALLACTPPPAAPTSPTAPIKSDDPDDISGPVTDRSEIPELRFRALFPEDAPVHSVTRIAELDGRWDYTLIVHTPSTEDSRFYRHDSMLDALFHPHDQPPAVLHVYSSTQARLEYPEGRIDRQLEPQSAQQLQAKYGDFVVLLLDAKGQTLIESTEPVSRQALHQAMNYRDGSPSPQDRPPVGPVN